MAGQVNTFTKGIVSDMDPILVESNQWVFPTVNVRFINKEGHGIIAMPLESNTHIAGGAPVGTAGEEFLIRPGYTLIGACELNGIAYLVLNNYTTGEGEIGTFPSPTAIVSHDLVTGVVVINQALTGFSRVYRPLVNYTGLDINYNPAVRVALNSIEFNFSNRVDIFAKPDYDGTVNLYLADHTNSNRHINTGFDQTGLLYTDRLYCINDFGSKMNLMPETNRNIDVDDFWFETYGQLLHGNYFFFFQYATRNFDKTEMVTECGPIQIDDAGEWCRNSYGGKAESSSNKKIRFKLTNLDRTYPFVKIGYIRYFSDSNLPVQSEYVIIERYYPVENDTIDINVTGTESSYNVNASEFLAIFPEERISKSHTQSENRYFGANWKAEDYDYDFLQEFFGRIELKWEDGRNLAFPLAHSENRIPGGPITPSWPKTHSQNRDSKITYSQTGYFRSEAYPFACVVELPNGSYTPAFLPKGIDSLDFDRDQVEDEYNGVTSLGKTNTKGFLRFPSSIKSHPYIGYRYTPPNNWHYYSHLYVLSVKYDFTKAIAWLNGLPVAQQDIFHSIVRRIHFVRGDRFVNIRYQGLTIATCHANGNILEARYTDMCSLPLVGSTFHLSYLSSFVAEQGYSVGFPDAPGFTPFTPGVNVGPYAAGQGLWGGTHANNDIFNQALWGGFVNDNNIELMYRQAFAPIFRGYMPMMYWLNKKPDNKNKDKVREVNYVSRFFCQPNNYGFFSPDFLANPNNDLSGIKCMYRLAKTMNANRDDILDPNTLIFKSNKHHFRDGWTPTWSNEDKLLYPRAYAFDAEAYFYSDGMLNAAQDSRHFWNDFTLTKVGESTTVSPQDAIVNSSKFINYSADFFHDRPNCLFYAEKTAGKDALSATRSFYLPKYIGIHTTLDSYGTINDDGTVGIPGAWTGNYNLDIVNLCNEDPQIIIISDIADPLSIPYKKIGIPKTYSELFNEPENSSFIFSGDCFLQRVYFKQMYWDGSSFGSSAAHDGWDTVASNDDQVDNPTRVTRKQSYFTHGIMLSAVFECAHNINMRVPGEKTTFFPKTDKYDFVKKVFNQDGVESWKTNNGYDVMLSDRTYFSYDSVIPKYIREFPQRIRHGEQSVNGEFEDMYRKIMLSYYKDFDSATGAINSVRDFNGTLFSVQDRAINRHFTNQEQIKTETNTGDMIIGVGPILSAKCQKLSDYGTQDQFSVTKGQRGVYGVDQKRKIIWRATVVSTNSGNLTGAVQNLTSEKMNETEMNNIIELFSNYSDIISGQNDNTINGIGIHTGYDQEYNEVLFTFMYPEGLNRVPVGKTLVFSEKLDEFTGYYGLYPSVWFGINNDLFSALSNADTNKSMIFRHNQKDTCLMFYGQQGEMELSVIFNGGGSKEAGPIVEKEFLSYNIDALQHEFSAVRYETEFQVSNKIPFREANRFWANPEYLEHTWQCPIFIKTDATNQAFQPNSSMRGKWMKLTLFYRQNIPTFVKTILSFFNSSHS